MSLAQRLFEHDGAPATSPDATAVFGIRPSVTKLPTDGFIRMSAALRVYWDKR